MKIYSLLKLNRITKRLISIKGAHNSLVDSDKTQTKNNRQQ